MSTRSSRLKKGRFVRLSATATTTSSNVLAARRTRSWCPKVMGSNVPGYTALIVMACPFQQLVRDCAGATAAPDFKPWRCRMHVRRFHMHHRAGCEPLRQRGKHSRQVFGAKGRIDEYNVIVRLVVAEEF